MVLQNDQSVLVVIDVQEKLAKSMHDREYLKNVLGIIKSSQLLDIPILLTEQAPQKIGETIFEITAQLQNTVPILKETFSCCVEPEFMRSLERCNRKQVVVAGIETHVCVYQTVRDLLKEGYEVFVVQDAVSARSALNHSAGLNRCQQEGAVLSTFEMTITEWLVSTRHPKFREIIQLMKENK